MLRWGTRDVKKWFANETELFNPLRDWSSANSLQPARVTFFYFLEADAMGKENVDLLITFRGVSLRNTLSDEHVPNPISSNTGR